LAEVFFSIIFASIELKFFEKLNNTQMRKIAFAFSGLLLMAFTACDNAASKVASENNTAEDTKVEAADVETKGTPVFTFTEETFDFGEIEEGTVAKHDFVFKNTGDAPLIITNAAGSCGCTVPEWPREPIAPGAEGTIHVEFNSQGRTGNQQKQVTISANTVPNSKVLKISAQVKPAADATAQN